MPVYFSVRGTDNTPTFEATGQWMGSWFGVAAVEDESEIARLRGLKREELSEDKYLESVKKKAVSSQLLRDFRQVVQGTAVQLADPRTHEGAEAKPEPPKPPPVESVIAPSKVPIRRRSSSAQPPKLPPT